MSQIFDPNIKWGEYIQFYQNNKNYKSIEHYVNGVLHGERILYYQNGK